jgi:methylated-DNA-[protein]-cysteine S-methyltransferase
MTNRYHKEQQLLYYDCCKTDFGLLYPHFKGEYLRALTFNSPQDLSPLRTEVSRKVCRELHEYFALKRKYFTVQVCFEGATDFQQAVWNHSLSVPYGETRTYKWLAHEIGNPRAYRAVGQALGRNPLPVIIPCHRIIRSDNLPGGYSGGIDIKLRLLEHEQK